MAESPQVHYINMHSQSRRSHPSKITTSGGIESLISFRAGASAVGPLGPHGGGELIQIGSDTMDVGTLDSTAQLLVFGTCRVA